MYKKQLRSLNRDLALARRDGGGGGAGRARAGSSARLKQQVDQMRALVEVRRRCVGVWVSPRYRTLTWASAQPRGRDEQEKNGLIKTLREALANATSSTAQLGRDRAELLEVGTPAATRMHRSGNRDLRRTRRRATTPLSHRCALASVSGAGPGAVVLQLKATLMERLSKQSQELLDLRNSHAEMSKVVDAISVENQDLRTALREREARVKQLVDYQVRACGCRCPCVDGTAFPWAPCLGAVRVGHCWACGCHYRCLPRLPTARVLYGVAAACL